MEMRSHVRRVWGPAAALAAACVAFGLGCGHPHVRPVPSPAAVHEPGPPPWAPAHGYRHKHAHGTELVFDARLGVYVVVGLDGHYFHDGRYFRRTAARWEVSDHLRGPWLVVETTALPAGLRARKAKGARKGRAHPAKRGR